MIKSGLSCHPISVFSSPLPSASVWLSYALEFQPIYLYPIRELYIAYAPARRGISLSDPSRSGPNRSSGKSTWGSPVVPLVYADMQRTQYTRKQRFQSLAATRNLPSTGSEGCLHRTCNCATQPLLNSLLYRADRECVFCSSGCGAFMSLSTSAKSLLYRELSLLLYSLLYIGSAVFASILSIQCSKRPPSQFRVVVRSSTSTT
jgi:hypothetical protein